MKNSSLPLLLFALLVLPAFQAQAQFTFTGNVENDFTEGRIFDDPDDDVSTSPDCSADFTSGSEIKDVRFYYKNNTLYVGINSKGIIGDTDGNDDPDASANNCIRDFPDLSEGEIVSVSFDLDEDGVFDFVVGVPADGAINSFNAYHYLGAEGGFGENPVLLGQSNVTYVKYANPSAEYPDFEFKINNFSALPGFNPDWDFDGTGSGCFFPFSVFVGASDEDGAGEDVLEIGSGLCSLFPIELISLDAKAAGKTASLSWTATNEKLGAYYEVQQLNEKQSFETIGEMNVFLDHEVNSYDFQTEKLPYGNHYFRLKIVDEDGKFTYSRTVNVEINALSSSVQLYPNPVSDQLWVDLGEEAVSQPVEVSIFAIDGTLIQRSYIADALSTLDTSGLRSGAYLVYLKNGASTEIQRITKF